MDNVIIYDKLEELNEGIESNGGGITSLLGKGCVKSVQRGKVETELTGASMNFSISTVDTNKSILIVDRRFDQVLCTLQEDKIVCFNLYGGRANVSFT